MRPRHVARRLIVGLLALIAPLAARAQSQSASLGLTAAGHVGINAGLALVAHAQPAFELGASMDMGWVWSRRNRVLIDVGFFSGLVRRPGTTGEMVSGPFYDFTAGVGIARLLPRAGPIEPYVGLGLGLHAIGSAIGDNKLDILYNANRFGSYAAIGTLITVSPDGRDGVQLEARGTAVRAANRVTFRLGYVRFFGARKHAR